MNQTFTYYSVSKEQVEKVLAKLGASGDANEGTLEGETPLGKVAGSYAFHEGSGQLQVTITKIPPFLSVHMIDGTIKTALVKAAQVGDVVVDDPPANPASAPTSSEQVPASDASIDDTPQTPVIEEATN
jgi:hypothetical protein